MKKYKYLIVISIILFFLFLIELIPTISLRTSIEEGPERTESTEFVIVTGTVENYHYYYNFIEILIDTDEELESNWFHSSYYMRDEYQGTEVYKDIYVGMTISIIYYPELESINNEDHYEIAGLYTDSKNYFDLSDYIQIYLDDYDYLITAANLHLVIDVIFFVSSATTMFFYFRLTKKRGDVNEEK